MFNREKGFTLVEVMIVLAIIGILAAIAYPAYTEQTRKARRGDAYNALQQAAAAQEKYYSTRRQYASFANPFNNTAALPSPDGYYTITVRANNATRSYDILATPVATGPQAHDTNCTSFTLSSNGKKSSTGAYATASQPLKCWQ